MNNELILSEENVQRLNEALTQYEVTTPKADLKKKSQRVFIASQMTIKDLKGNARLEGEDFEEYRERRTIENTWLKMKSKGEFGWLSIDMQQESIADGMDFYVNKGGGTYIKAVHGVFEHKKKKTEKMKARNVKRALSIIEDKLTNK